jgi:hypothetical protein
MVLVDTSVWIRHFRASDRQLVKLLEKWEVLVHPFIAGEIACGRLKDRREVLDRLAALPCAVIATHDEAMSFIEANSLSGSGIGYVDAHLLASARLSGSTLFTADAALSRMARHLGLGHPDE